MTSVFASNTQIPKTLGPRGSVALARSAAEGEGRHAAAKPIGVSADEVRCALRVAQTRRADTTRVSSSREKSVFRNPSSQQKPAVFRMDQCISCAEICQCGEWSTGITAGVRASRSHLSGRHPRSASFAARPAADAALLEPFGSRIACSRFCSINGGEPASWLLRRRIPDRPCWPSSLAITLSRS